MVGIDEGREGTKRMLENFKAHNDRVSKNSSDAVSGAVSESQRATLVNVSRAIAQFDAEPGVEVALPPIPTEVNVIDLLMKNARVLAANNETRLAFNILRNVLIRDSDYAPALKMMGDCLKAENRFEEALKCYRAFAKITRSTEANAAVAELYYLCERDEVALASYREVLKSVVTDAALLFEIYKNVGNIHTRAGDFDAAEEFYDKAYTLRPESDVLLVNYGTLEIQRGAWNEAVSRFRRAVEINPRSDRGWVGLAMVHRTMGDLELAKANLQRALDINSSNRTALRLVVDWAAQDHDFSSAIPRLQEYVGGAGCEDAEISFMLARTMVQAGHLRDARLEVERVLALDPAFENADALARALDRHLNQAAA